MPDILLKLLHLVVLAAAYIKYEKNLAHSIYTRMVDSSSLLYDSSKKTVCEKFKFLVRDMSVILLQKIFLFLLC